MTNSTLNRFFPVSSELSDVPDPDSDPVLVEFRDPAAALRVQVHLLRQLLLIVLTTAVKKQALGTLPPFPAQVAAERRFFLHLRPFPLELNFRLGSG